MAKVDRADALRRGQETLVKNLSSGQGERSISRFVVVAGETPGGPTRSHFHEGPCHSAVNRYKHVHALVTSPNVEAWKDPEQWGGGRGSSPLWDHGSFYGEACRWWEWLMHESPWCHLYITKPSAGTAGERGVAIDCSAPSNLAMFAIIATRHPHEYPERVRAWSRAVAMGGDPHVLSLLVETIKVTTGSREDMLVNFTRCGGDIHDMFNPFKLTTTGLKAFVKWDLTTGELNKPLTDTGRYNGIHRLFKISSAMSTARLPLRKFTGSLKDDVEHKRFTWEWGTGLQKSTIRGLSFEGATRSLAQYSQELRHAYS